MKALRALLLATCVFAVPTLAKAATANLTDMSILSTDTTFQNRVLQSMLNYCSNTVFNEAISATTIFVHTQRRNFCVGVLLNPNNYKTLLSLVAAGNQTVANDATAGGTLVGMTGIQVATAAAACTDTDINNAVAAALNAFIGSI